MSIRQRCLAELFATFALVFTGTGAIVINDVTGGSVTHVGIGLTFGLIVMAMIYALGDTSGAHMNPAVTLGLVAARRFAARDALPYIASQLTGALVASGVLKAMFPDHPTLGATLPRGSDLQSFVLEFILTAILMVTILGATRQSSANRGLAGIAIGGVIALEAIFAGPISGASMNPVRSLAPALLSGQVESLWLYLVAPTLAAILASPPHEKGQA